MVLNYFVPLKPMNLKNTSGHWSVRYRYSRDMREATASLGKEAMRLSRVEIDPEVPKRILLMAFLPRRFDAQDGLPASMAPVVDGLQVPRDVAITRGKRKGQTTHLVGCGIIHHDGVESGHQVAYDQQVRKPWGVFVHVEWT
jgi:hypothetical protein